MTRPEGVTRRCEFINSVRVVAAGEVSDWEEEKFAGTAMEAWGLRVIGGRVELVREKVRLVSPWKEIVCVVW